MQKRIMSQGDPVSLLIFVASLGLTSVLFALPTSAQELFVSHESGTIFDNSFAGPQVVEVMVADALISDTTTAKAEPDVTIDGKSLRMVQAEDGNWYAYFAFREPATSP